MMQVVLEYIGNNEERGEERMGSNSGGQLMNKRETDWFRGVAAVMVVLSHYAEWWTWFTPTEGNAEIFRLALSKLGAYGVDIFFLFSGYAMVKSLGQERMHPQFIWKRIKNVYIPYFLVVGVIELLSGGFTSLHDFWQFASGKDYWYMFVLFIFYIGFIVVYTIMGGRGPRCVVFGIFTYVFSYALYEAEMQDFWFVSNIAFAIGVVAAEYEEPVKKAADKAGYFVIAALGAGMFFVIRSGLDENVAVGREEEQLLRMEIGAAVIWTLLVLFLVSRLRIKEKIFAFLGKCSLYIYLTHTFIFMWCVNAVEWSFALRFLASAVMTAAVSALCCLLVGGVTKKLSSKKPEVL
jgi:Predicted acyltransferases